MVKERAPPKPQGDFRVPAGEAEARYRMVMGLNAREDRFAEWQPDEERSEGPEKAVNHAEIENRARRRAMDDTRRENMLRPTTERPPDHHVDFIDLGTHYEDPSGRIIDKKYNVMGLYGTEAERGPAPGPAKAFEPSAVEKAVPVALVGQPAEAPSADAFEDRLNKKMGLQMILTEAFRGLFGGAIADHIMTRSQVSDRRPGFERPTVSHVIMDLGLMKPWNAPRGKALNVDRPSRPDDTALAVGLRAIETVLAKKTAPEILELPKAEKDDLAVAIGRTLLNAMSVLPDRSGDRPEVIVKFREEVQAAIASSVGPSILKGLVAPEALSDRPQPEHSAVPRATAPSRAVGAGLMDRTMSEPEDRPRADPVVTRPILGDFVAMGHARKRDPFNMDADEKAVPRETAYERPVAPLGPQNARHTGPIAPARLEVNPRDASALGFSVHHQ